MRSCCREFDELVAAVARSHAAGAGSAVVERGSCWLWLHDNMRDLTRVRSSECGARSSRRVDAISYRCRSSRLRQVSTSARAWAKR
ncbi:MAG: DUF4427 domain-containing protein [Polyangiaceae bacterium]|nr:DUF4427 domain-containing protein [Polyangiaceae bacterium]